MELQEVAFIAVPTLINNLIRLVRHGLALGSPTVGVELGLELSSSVKS